MRAGAEAGTGAGERVQASRVGSKVALPFVRGRTWLSAGTPALTAPVKALVEVSFEDAEAAEKGIIFIIRHS